MSVTEWKAIAVDGMPSGFADQTWFFCWGLGWDEVVILEFWTRSDTYPGGVFGDDGGVWTEVTHWMPVTLPAVPTLEGESPQGE